MVIKHNGKDEFPDHSDDDTMILDDENTRPIIQNESLSVC